MMVSESGEGVGCAHQLEEPEREGGGERSSHPLEPQTRVVHVRCVLCVYARS